MIYTKLETKLGTDEKVFYNILTQPSLKKYKNVIIEVIVIDKNNEIKF